MITRAELGDLARTHRLVPITRTLFADAETPVGVYRKLAAGRPGTFLLESAEPGASFSRWSFVGVNAVASLRAIDNTAVWSGDVPSGLPTEGEPLAVLGAAWRAIKGPRLPGLPPLTGGFVGYLGYDVVRAIERLPSKAVDELGIPDFTMLLVTDLAAVDHHRCTVELIANALVDAQMSDAELDAAFADACSPPGSDAGGPGDGRLAHRCHRRRRRAGARGVADAGRGIPAGGRAGLGGRPGR